MTVLFNIALSVTKFTRYKVNSIVYDQYTAKIRSCFNLGVVISVSYSDEITVARSHVHTLAQHSLHTTTITVISLRRPHQG